MEYKYRIFDKGFNKILSLVQEIDEKVADRFKAIVRLIPDYVKDKTAQCEDFLVDHKMCNIEMLRTVNSLSLDFVIKGEKYLRNNIFIRRIFEEDLEGEEVDIELFSITQRNSDRKKPPIVFGEESGMLKMMIDENDSNKEIKYMVGLKHIGEYYFLYTKTNIRGVEFYDSKDILEFCQMAEYLETEEDYEEELGAYLDIDEDFQKKLNKGDTNE